LPCAGHFGSGRYKASAVRRLRDGLRFSGGSFAIGTSEFSTDSTDPMQPPGPG